MKKQFLIALALIIGVFSFAQKKELKAAEKAVKGNNYSEAKAALSQAESMMSSMDDKTKSKFYYLQGSALYANGAGTDADIDSALESLSKVKGSYTSEIAGLKKAMENSQLTKANELYRSQNFKAAADKFENLYKIVPNDTIYLYYAAVSAVSGQDYDKSLVHYLELNELGYTGRERQYFATNIDTNEEELLDQVTRDLYVKSGSYVKPGERLTESKSKEITKNIALIYVSLGKTDEALASIKEARRNEPKNVDLILTEANLHYKSKNLVEYKKLIEEATTLDPNNIDLFYNLGVISADSGDRDGAMAYYNKVLKMDSNYVNAHTNMAALILEEEQSLIEEMNALGSSNADNIRYDELKSKRMQVYNNAIPYLESVMKIDSKNLQAAKTLLNIYSAVDDTTKFKAMKETVNALSTGGGGN